MLVGFMRHGRAENTGGDDRRLTPEVREEVKRAAEAMPFKPSLILASPLRRAVETAEIVAGVHGVEYSVLDDLRPGKFSLEVAERVASDRLLLIGHNPSFSRVVSALSGCAVELGTAWIAVLERFNGSWRLVAVVPPPLSL